MSEIRNEATASASPNPEANQLRVADSGLATYPRLHANIADWRRRSGYVLIVLSIAVVTRFAWCSLTVLDGFQYSATPAPLEYARLAAHAAISVAFVLFWYGVLRAGERMALPHEWIRSTEDLKLLMGLRQPSPLSIDQLRSVLELILTKIDRK